MRIGGRILWGLRAACAIGVSPAAERTMALAKPGLTVKPLHLEGVCAKGAPQVVLRGLVARNVGRVASAIEARSDVEWMHPSQGCADVRPGGRCPFEVQIDCGAFAGSLAPVASGGLRIFAPQANSGVDVGVRIRLTR